ncbi:hypothetical protein GGD81_002922 [Rhodobium orientis]|uniref:Uncharacterized protein n=1 Tax=Rhodobium orientis TaxID=34017 RepID=A0A327JL95_9HYPH|nr:hypothetical protein [Rhodobium orientis]MBB4303870.1 hypothetical protein [Rhodobium orientis]MBK5951417.1 hypothetical protein [Rhodobium orientis]RAI26124.1 hypothetical protein CH339_15240 [Rhodobium orientis]
MIFHPPILAILLASTLSLVTLVWASGFAARLVRKWDVASGHAGQIALEKRTYLVSTALVFVLALEAVSLILFTENAERMSVLFVGAMCAIGTLNVNAYGFPALILKVALFFGAAVWLIVNHADGLGRDYPLTRFKYGLLIALSPLVVAVAAVQFAYFYNLRADVITSCCSRVFVPNAGGLEADLSSLDPAFALGLLFGGLGVIAVLALAALRWRAGRLAYAAVSLVYFAAGISAVISVVSPYIYEQFHHHCPFCILKPEYGYIGYWLYLPLFVGTSAGLGLGALSLKRTPASLQEALPPFRRRLILTSLAGFGLFGAVALTAILRSNLIMFG